MDTRVLVYSMLASLIATAAAAQQRPIFDPDDFVDPRQHGQNVFISRLVLGAAHDFIDDYRPLRQDAGFVLVTNSVYWKRWEFDYKHSEVRDEHKPPDVFRCGCNPPIYFPTPPPDDATPAATRPGSKDTVQLGWYHELRDGSAEPRIMLRYRLTFSHQHLGTTIRDGATRQIVERRSGDEQSVGLDLDTHVRIAGHDVWGSLVYARTVRSGTVDDRKQQELAYTSRFPGRALGPVLVRAMLTVGGVTGRGTSGLNIVDPAFEAFWHDHTTQANVHLVWSPQSTRSHLSGWETHGQIAIFVDRALFVGLFGN
jgi:hypothetical protein